MKNFDKTIIELKLSADNYFKYYSEKYIDLKTKTNQIRGVLEYIPDSMYFNYANPNKDFLSWDGNDFYIGDSKEPRDIQ